jgi:muramoyltetrapeptide carboxypeptidase
MPKRQKKKAALHPARLKKGDTIGIIAPASSFNRKAFDRGVDVLKSMGFKIFIPEGLFHRKGYLAGSDTHRAELVNHLFNDPSVDAIICARGGFGSLRVLSHLNYESIRIRPKLCVGFSDISILLSVLYTRCEWVTFHGPVVTSLANASQKTIEHLYTVLTKNDVLILHPENGVTIRPGLAKGPVVGGNLTSLCHLTGTPFQPDYKGHILVFEDRGEKTYRIDRMLSQMKLSGCFNQVAGIVLGSFIDCGDMKDIFRIMVDIFDDVCVPILAGFDIGHGPHNLTIPLGVLATVDADRQVLSYAESATV